MRALAGVEWTWAGARLALFAFVLLALPPRLVAEEPREMRGVALIVGNGDYEHLPPLENPDSDAEAIEDLFDDLGFETFDARDADARKLRRAIERFIEDAEGADVAVFYYAGHGIEAGGENFLVPVDADMSALGEAGEKLVPLSALLDELRAAVPITIVLLDACRDNPFPPDSMVRISEDAEPVEMAAGGLGETRSVKPFARAGAPAPAKDDTDLGTVIGFAAEPGQTALDGEAGSNSPYAAAVLRHVSAMTGEEFGTVMRMIAEEVYLKTGGRQRPWVNESLRRLLYLGAEPDAPEGAEGDILRERRRLLVTISALPDPERRQIEGIARDGGVPMDMLYGMLRALGAEAPTEPAKLEAVLREQTEKLKQLQRDRAVVDSTDPEIKRLAALADQAVAEGALETAVALNVQAKQRVVEIEGTVADAEADVKARRLEFAEVYARSGKTAYMTFDYEQSAADYEQAFLQVERWDDAMAWSHRGNQAVALQALGWRRGHTGKLLEALDMAREVVGLAQRLPDPHDLALSRVFLANTLLATGQRLRDENLLREAIGVYEAALPAFDQTGMVYDVLRTDVLHNLAGALYQLGAQLQTNETLLAAIDRFEDIARAIDRDANPKDWSRTIIAQANAMTDLARRERDPARLRAAIALVEQVVALHPKDIDRENWIDPARALANAHADLGDIEDSMADLLKADALYDEVIAAMDPKVAPVVYGNTLYGRGLNAHSLAADTDKQVWFDKAIGDFRVSLGFLPRAELPREWRDSHNAMGSLLRDFALKRKDAALARQGREEHMMALAAVDRATEPVEWARIAAFAADALRAEGEITANLALLDQAFGELTDALALAPAGSRSAETAATRIAWLGDALAKIAAPDATGLLSRLRRAETALAGAGQPGALASVRSALGRKLYAVGIAAKDQQMLADGISAYRSALVPEAKAEPWLIWPNVQANLALALRELGRLNGDVSLFPQAAAAWREAQAIETDSALWIGNQRELAGMLDTVGDAAALREAAEAWQALAARLPQSDRPGRAVATENRARSLHNLAAAGGGEADSIRAEAISGYRDALLLFGNADADASGRIGENLADLLAYQGQASGDAARLREAIGRYDAVIARPRSDDPDQVRRVRRSLAGTLLALSYRGGGEPELLRAVEAFRLAFGPDVGAALPADWVGVAEFANALRMAGFQRQDRAMLREAAETLHRVLALPEQDLDDAARAWVNVSLGDALVAAGELERNGAAFDQAVSRFRAALPFYTQEAAPAYWRGPHGSLAGALSSLGVLAEDAAALKESAELYGSLLAATSRDAEALAWSGYANGRAYALVRLARLDAGDASTLAEAESLARDASAAFQAAGTAVDVAHAEDTLCGALAELGRRRGDRATVEEALSVCDRALATFKGQDQARLIEYALDTRARALSVLGEIGR